MKKKIRQTILLLSATCLLAACGKKTEQTSTSSSAKTEQTSQTKSGTTTSQTATSSSVDQETESSQTTPAETTLSAETSHSQLQILPAIPIPAELVGKWQGQSPQARAIEVTIGADGSFTTYADFRLSEDEEGDYLIHTYTAQITDLVEYAPNHYLIRGAEGDSSALLPGLTGLGGRITPGFTLENGQYKVNMWGNPMEPEGEAIYDLVSEPHAYASLEKVE